MSALRSKHPSYDRDLLQEIADLAVRFLGARSGALGLLNERRDAFECFIAAGGGRTESSAVGPLPRGWGLMDALIEDPRPIRLVAPRERGADGKRAPARSFLGVPLLSGKKHWGNFYFADKEGEPEFRPTDERLAECLARIAADYLQGALPRGEASRYIGLLEDALEEAGAVCITDPSREIIFWNRGARRLFGFTERETLGRPFVHLLVPPEERQKRRRGFDPSVQRTLLNGQTAQADCVRLHKDGRRLPIRMTVSPILHRVAGIVAVTCVGRYERL